MTNLLELGLNEDTYYPIQLKLQHMFTRLYLHIPFCLSKCEYCAFNSQELLDSDLNEYAALLLEEMRLLPAATIPGKQLDSIYFGGGTPSLLPPEQAALVIRLAADLFGLSPDAEITLEANPGTIDQARLAAFRTSGVNRLSLGVQSFDDTFLRSLGRAHNAEQAFKAYKDARRAGFKNIGIDLMHSLPSQNIIQWQNDLKRAIQLSPEHLSIYGLTVEEGTPFYRRYPYNSPEMPDDDLSADMFEMADDLLTASGYEHYEIANYARPGYRSRHNSGYWQRDGNLGLGVGAHSLFKDGNGVRTSNVNTLDNYREAVTAGRLPRLDSQRLSQDEAMEEYMFLRLRMADGISLDEFEQEFGRPCRGVYGKVIDELVSFDLLLSHKTDLRLTKRGMLLSNQVFTRFLL
jgi:oxygen-independent coproporphyrinogen-3 oxidase